MRRPRLLPVAREFMKRDPDYVYLALLPLAVVSTGLMMLHWTSVVVPVLTEAARKTLLEGIA